MNTGTKILGNRENLPFSTDFVENIQGTRKEVARELKERFAKLGAKVGTYIGGHHVAVLQFGCDVVKVTSDHADFQ